MTIIQVLEAVGLNTQEIITSAADRFSAGADIIELLGEKQNIGSRITRLLDSVYHQNRVLGEHATNDRGCDI